MINDIAREPLVQFLVLGAAIFIAYDRFGESTDSATAEIVVSVGHIERMSQTWRKTRMRPPTQSELENLVADYIREEIYYREAVALGLDRDNAVIRRHLRQKMEFLTDDIASRAEPGDDELRDFLANNPGRFQEDAKLAFRHLFFSTDRRGSRAESDAYDALQQLGAITSFDDARAASDPFPFPQSFEDVAQRDIASMFGAHFADGLLGVDPGKWSGPISSAYGVHLVIVDRREDPRLPALDQIRDAVVREWRESRRQQANEDFYARLRSRYRVVVERPEWLDRELRLDGVELP